MVVRNLEGKNIIKLNPKRIEIIRKHVKIKTRKEVQKNTITDFLATNVLSNPRIFEINYDYLRRKWDYVTHEEEERI